MGETINFACPGGGSGSGHLATAAGARAGIVVIQEWWGLNDQIRGVADRFAAAGYSALAPDLYDGRITQEPDEANHMMSGLDWVGATEVEVQGAVQHLKASCDRVAVMGFCMGGALTVIAGVKLPECDAAVCYYGIPPIEQADPAAMRVPFQGHFANQDDWCTPAAADALETALAGTGAAFEMHRYEAQHGFFNETVAAHDAAAAALSWERTLAFLGTHL
ncbi:MAG: dienelactone hydrolase family protein [Alphaproteobacteria bacterium]|jgi:carboxymethylenebutenolidase|nr:dienelactone hydrolase family protein [Alphaproteobacteria bacterium]